MEIATNLPIQLTEVEREILGRHQFACEQLGYGKHASSTTAAIRAAIQLLGQTQTGQVNLLSNSELGAFVGGLVQKVIEAHQLTPDQAQGLVNIAENYTMQFLTGDSILTTKDGKPVISELINKELEKVNSNEGEHAEAN